MKKLLTSLLTLLMVFTLVGCNSKENETTVVEEPQQQEVVEEVKQEEPTGNIVGGFVDAEDPTITDELKAIFDEGLSALLGAKYEPVKLLATQVVNGINYKFLATGTKTTNPVTIGTYNVIINKATDGSISLVDIELVEEKQEEKKTVDPTQYSYWVVVYDQLGNELSRTTAKYGTTVKDPDGNSVVVKGNTYFHTTVDYSSPKDDKDEPSPAPSHNCQYETNYLVYCNSTGYESNIDVYELKTNGYKKIANIPNLLVTKYTGDLSAGKWSHTDNNPVTSGNVVFTYCEDHEAHTFEPPCSLDSPIIYIIERSGVYAHWHFYEYDETSSTYVINGSYSCSTGDWHTLPWELATGKYYHVSTEAEWSYWKTDDSTRTSAIYTECSEANIDHTFGS